MKKNKYLVLIPAYNPSNKLLELIKDLKKENLDILIVNDGSCENINIFNKIKKEYDIKILEYEKNMGKGHALKYGMQYYINNYKDYKGIVTVDADYQHIPKDVLKIMTEMDNNPNTIVLGCRNFNSKKVPFLNRMGNKITSLVFKFLYGKYISDTQTGLRGIPNSLMEKCLYIEGNRFEYEIGELIYLVNNHINMTEVSIETVYYESRESKFHKVSDSIRIYKLILKESFRFMLTSLVSSFLDIILFTILIALLSKFGDISIIISTFCARIIADLLNFYLTKNFVFYSVTETKKIILSYYLLSFTKMALSAIFVLLISKYIFISKTFIKMFVDILIYFLSYNIQKKYIFKTENNLKTYEK